MTSNDSLDTDERRSLAREIIDDLFSSAIAAVDPAAAVQRALQWRGDSIVVGDTEIGADHGIHLVAVGKAAVAMTRGALAFADTAIVSGDVITKDGHATGSLPVQIRVHEASHPIPDDRGVAATSCVLDALKELDKDVVVLALISGGGSALLEAPCEGISLAELATLTGQLLRAGAPIDALNAVRSPLSQVKGGGLRRAAAASPWITLILSDVLGNDPQVIASGPTVLSSRVPGAARSVLIRYDLLDRVPKRTLALLDRGEADGSEGQLGHSVLCIIGDNATALQAAAHRAGELALNADIAWNAVEGEAAVLGTQWVKALAAVPASIDIVLGGGEATVTVRGQGSGGRNTEFALAAALELERLDIDDWIVASLATDGQDALTGLAGAVADRETAQRARLGGIDPELALAENDSQAVFAVTGGCVETGPTGTNVNDLYFAVRA